MKSETQGYPISTKPMRLNAPVGIAFDQGRAAALQLLTHDENPYSRRLEPEENAAWLQGFQSLSDH